MKVTIDVDVLQTREGTYLLKIKNGFGEPQVRFADSTVQMATPDELTRLPLLMAAAMTRKLEKNRHKGGRGNWLADGPKALLKRLDEEVAELKTAVRLHPDRVLDEAADVANFAMFIADKADKLEPVPDAGDVVDAEVEG